MAVEIEGVRYLSLSEVAAAIGVSRQTLWRWRRIGQVSLGQRFRDGQVLYTPAQVEGIRRYANRLEPAEPAAPRVTEGSDGD